MRKVYKAIPIITKGNLIFRDKIIIDTVRRTVSYWKRNYYFIGYRKVTLSIRNIASVSIHQNNELLYFSNIRIETVGGKVIVASGFLPKDTSRIKHLIEQL